jgi:hypothetical protein
MQGPRLRSEFRFCQWNRLLRAGLAAHVEVKLLQSVQACSYPILADVSLVDEELACEVCLPGHLGVMESERFAAGKNKVLCYFNAERTSAT